MISEEENAIENNSENDSNFVDDHNYASSYAESEDDDDEFVDAHEEFFKPQTK